MFIFKWACTSLCRRGRTVGDQRLKTYIVGGIEILKMAWMFFSTSPLSKYLRPWWYGQWPVVHGADGQQKTTFCPTHRVTVLFIEDVERGAELSFSGRGSAQILFSTNQIFHQNVLVSPKFFGFRQDRQTDGQTDRQTDAISMFWAFLVLKN